MTCLWGVRRRRRRGGRRPSILRRMLWKGLGCYWTRGTRGERGRRGGSGVFRSPRPTPRFAALFVDIWQWLCLVLLVILPCAVFYCVVGRPKMLVIMAGMFQKDSYAARKLRPSLMPVWHVQGWYCWFFTSSCVPSYAVRPRCSASRPVWTRRTVLSDTVGFFWEIISGKCFVFCAMRGSTADSRSCVRLRRLSCGSVRSRRRHWQWHVHGWFACYVAPRVVFP